MSFRSPRVPKLVTIFHDPHSAVSQRVLRMLQARSRPASVTLREQQSGHRHREGIHRIAPAQEFLDEAASAVEDEPVFELEVVDRSRATHDQWRVIASYMQRSRPSQVEGLKEEVGPFVVDWDDGKVVQSEADAERLASELIKQREGGRWSSKPDDKGCVIL